jgi:hypothetical protein
VEDLPQGNNPRASERRIAHIGPAGDCCAAEFQSGQYLLWVLAV